MSRLSSILSPVVSFISCCISFRHTFSQWQQSLAKTTSILPPNTQLSLIAPEPNTAAPKLQNKLAYTLNIDSSISNTSSAKNNATYTSSRPLKLSTLSSTPMRDIPAHDTETSLPYSKRKDTLTSKNTHSNASPYKKEKSKERKSPYTSFFFLSMHSFGIMRNIDNVKRSIKKIDEVRNLTNTQIPITIDDSDADLKHTAFVDSIATSALLSAGCIVGIAYSIFKFRRSLKFAKQHSQKRDWGGFLQRILEMLYLLTQIIVMLIRVIQCIAETVKAGSADKK